MRSELKKERALRMELEWKLRQLLGRHFGPSSEKFAPGELDLFAEAVQAVIAEESGTAGEAPAAATPGPGRKPRGKRTRFPETLREEIIEVDVPEEQRVCPVTGAERRLMRWEESVKYNLVPAHFVRVVIRRAVRAVSPAVLAGPGPDCPEPVVSAEMPAPYRVIPGAVAGCGLLVHLIVSKYCDHLPFYRLEQIFRRRHGVHIDRSTMCHWMKRCVAHLQVLYEAILHELLHGNYLQIDETMIRLMDPDSPGKARNSYFWVIVRPGHGVLFHFDPGRSHQVAVDLLGDFTGRLQSDGYGAYRCLASRNTGLELFGCWAHARRKFVEAVDANGPDAVWYVMEIQKLYRVEEEARRAGLDHGARSALRLEKSRPVLESIRRRLDADGLRSAILPASPLGKAIGYTLGQWSGLECYAEPGNGMVEIDNNLVENAIRPTAIGKKNWLFIGHPNAGQQSAILYTIIENCRLHGIDPAEYLEDVLPRIQDHAKSRISELLPRQWKAARDAKAA